MRGLVGQAVAAAAWAFATPVLADAPAYEDLEHLDRAAAFFKVPLTKDAPELIRLDVTNTDAICDPTTLSINDQVLPLGAHHLGQGALTLSSGLTVEAIWTIACVSHDKDGELQFEPGNISPIRDFQFVNMKPGIWIVVDIVKVDGEEVHAGFEANFMQGGDYVRWHFADVYGANGVDGEKVEMVTHFGGEVDWTVPWERNAIQEADQELEWLRTGQWADEFGGTAEDWRDHGGFGSAGLFESEPTLEELEGLEHSAAFFDIDLGLYDEEDRHILRLDVQNSDQNCDPENKIYLAGKPLRRPNAFPFSETHPDNLVENGFFTLPSGPKIQASWTVSCLSPERYGPTSPLDHDDPVAAEKLSSAGVYVRVDIRAVDDVDVSHRNLGFDIEFEQDVREVQWNTVNDHFPATRTLLWTKGTDYGWSYAIYSTPEGVAAQWDIPAAEDQPSERIPTTTDDQEAVESSESVKNKCTDLLCLLDQMEEGMTIEESKQIDTQAEEFVNEILAKQNKKQKPLTATQNNDEDHTFLIATDPQQMKPITAMDSPSISSDTATATATPTGLFLTSLPPQDQDLLLTLFLAGTAFLLFTLISLFIFKSRSEPTVQRLPVHRETPEERLARVANRRHAFTSFFCRLFSFSEKTNEAPQGRDLRTEEASSTMEQEISQFREAANMVESMIAAEEGRHQQPETSNAEASPPSYENDSAESGVVADGFRYTRVADGAWGEGENEGCDRLGYGDK